MPKRKWRTVLISQIMTKEYSEYILAIDVNLDTTEMLDTTWGLFSSHFRPEEVNMKTEMVNKYWTSEKKVVEGEHQE